MAKVNVVIKNIDDDFSFEVENNKKVIILVDHSISSAKLEVFKRYIERRFYKNIDEYVIAVAKKEQIPTNRMKPGYVINLLEEDMKSVYEDFLKKNEGIIVDTEYSFHYVTDVAEDRSGELMSVALMRTKDGFNKVEFSPIIKLKANEYDAIVNGGESEEEKIIHSIVTEQVKGDELYGLSGYLTNGKFTTLDMYMQNLCDIVPILRKMQKRRSEVVKYKRHKINNRIYLNSLGINNTTASDSSKIVDEVEHKEETKLPGEDDLIV